MRALVIGATGIIGNHVVRALLDEGIEVRAFSRGITPAYNLEGLKVEIFKGDLRDVDSLARAMDGCRWAFHTAAYYPTHPFDLKGHLRRAKEEIDGVIQAVSHSHVERFVYTSSLTTIGKPFYYGQLADESCRYNLKKPPHPYFAVKYLMEEELRKKVYEGFPVVIVNPTGCFGPYELKPPQLCLIPQLVKQKMPGYVDHAINVVDVADVGRGHVLAAKKGKIGERYILGGHNVSVKWVIQTICRTAGVPSPSFRISLPPALALAWTTEFIGHYLLNKIALFPILGLRFIQYGQHMDLSKAQKELGLNPSPMEPCFERAVDWFKTIGYC